MYKRRAFLGYFLTRFAIHLLNGCDARPYDAVAETKICMNNPPILNLDPIASACEGTTSGNTCAFVCLDGYSPTRNATCAFGEWSTTWSTIAECEQLGDACVPHICDDTCEHIDTGSTGRCDDGGLRSASHRCAYGTDCADCGWRDRLRVPANWTKRCDYGYWGTETAYFEATYPRTSELSLVLSHAAASRILYKDTLFGLINQAMPVEGSWLLEGYNDIEMKQLSCHGCPLGVFKQFTHKTGTRRNDFISISDIVRSNKELSSLFPSIAQVDASSLPSAAVRVRVSYTNFGGYGVLWNDNKAKYTYSVKMIAPQSELYEHSDDMAGVTNVLQTPLSTERVGLRIFLDVGGDIKRFDFATLFINIVAGSATLAAATMITEQFLSRRFDAKKRKRYNMLHSAHCLNNGDYKKTIKNDLYKIFTCFTLRRVFGCARNWLLEDNMDVGKLKTRASHLFGKADKTAAAEVAAAPAPSAEPVRRFRCSVCDAKIQGSDTCCSSCGAEQGQAPAPKATTSKLRSEVSNQVVLNYVDPSSILPETDKMCSSAIDGIFDRVNIRGDVQRTCLEGSVIPISPHESSGPELL